MLNMLKHNIYIVVNNSHIKRPIIKQIKPSKFLFNDEWEHKPKEETERKYINSNYFNKGLWGT